MRHKMFRANHIDLLAILEKGKRHHVLIKVFNTLTHGHALYSRRKFFIVIVYKLLGQKKYWNVVLEVALKLMARKWVNTLNSKNMKKQKKSPCLIYADF